MNPRIEKSRNALADICRSFNVKKLSLFGSATRTDFSSDSDVDILVEFYPGKSPSLGKFIELQDQLAELFGCRVEIATSSILRNPYRNLEIQKDLRELYAA